MIYIKILRTFCNIFLIVLLLRIYVNSIPRYVSLSSHHHFTLKKPCCSFNEKTLKADKLRLSSWILKYYSERVHTPRSSLERNASWEADKESTYSASRMNACKKEKI